MRNDKKTKKEKSETRAEQTRRFLARKKAAGLIRVSLWIPAEIADKCAKLDRIGVVFADPSEKRRVSVLLENGRLSEISYHANLLDTNGQ